MDDKYLDEYFAAYRKIQVNPPGGFTNQVFRKILLAEARRDSLRNFLVPGVAFVSSIIIFAVLIFSSVANITANSAGFDDAPSKIISTAVVKNLLPSKDDGKFTISSLHNCWRTLESCKMQLCVHGARKTGLSTDGTNACDCSTNKNF